MRAKPSLLGKDEVASSNLASSSIKDRNRLVSVFFYTLLKIRKICVTFR